MADEVEPVVPVAPAPSPAEPVVEEPVPVPVEPVVPARLDQALATQLSVLTLTNAITQQQLNSAAARNMLNNVSNVLTLGVQLNHLAALNMLTSLSPMTAAAMQQLVSAGQPQTFATLQAISPVPKGTG